MNIVLAFVSPSGTTRSVAMEIQQTFTRLGHSVSLFNLGEGDHRNASQIDPRALSEADVLGIGYPIYHLAPISVIDGFFRTVLPAVHLKNPQIRVFLFATYAGIASGRGLSRSVGQLQRLEIPLTGILKIAAPHFWDVTGFPGSETRHLLHRFARELHAASFEPIPWKTAEARLRPRKIRVRALSHIAPWLGKKRCQPITIVPERCVCCGRCARECVALALRMRGSAVLDPTRCIHCYHCVTVCPRHAIQCNLKGVKNQVEQNKRLVGLETPRDEIIR